MNHDFFYREWNWIEQLSAAFHVFAANIKPILKVLLIVFLPISILESIINGRMLNAYTVFQQIAQAGVSLSNPRKRTVLVRLDAGGSAPDSGDGRGNRKPYHPL